MPDGDGATKNLRDVTTVSRWEMSKRYMFYYVLSVLVDFAAPF